MVAVVQYYKSLDVGWKAVFQVLHTKCSPKTLVDSYSDVRLSFPSLKPFPNVYFSCESTLQDHNNNWWEASDSTTLGETSYGGPEGRATRRCVCDDNDATIEDGESTIDDDDDDATIDHAMRR